MISSVIVKQTLHTPRVTYRFDVSITSQENDFNLIRRVAAGDEIANIAVLSHGQVIFRGSPAQLIQAASGHVWTLTSSSTEKPDHELTFVSMLHLAEGIQYRLVGPSAESYSGAQPVQPGLEDAYVWLMKNAENTVDMMNML